MVHTMTIKAQRIFENEVYRWPGVTRKKQLSRTRYYVNGREFASIDGDFLILSRVTPEDRKILEQDWQAGPEIIGNKTIGFKIKIPFDTDSVIKLLPYVKNSYNHTSTWKGV
jgi:hypothetical protein